MYGDQQAQVRLLIVKGTGPSLFGRDWLEVFIFNLKSMIQEWIGVNGRIPEKALKMSTNVLQGLLVENDELFKPGLGTLKEVEVSIDIDQNASPKFVKARPVPFAMKTGGGG